ncbi:MAG: lipopolysaccharide biosynthesis protein [Pyrinomonadaceae bacterium]
MTPEQIIEPEIKQQTLRPHERQSSSWDIRNAPRNYAALVAYQILSAAFSFGAVWLITRHLGSEGYGGIVAIIAASQVAQVFINWTSTAVVRFGVDEFVETEKISRTFWVRLLVLIVNLAVVVLISRLWFPTLADWLKLQSETFWLVIAHFAVTVLWIHVQMSLQAAKLPRIQGLLQMIERLLIFAGVFTLTAAANLKPSLAMLCYIIAPAVMILAGLFKLRHFISARFDIDRAFVRKIVAYSVPLLPFSLVGYFSGSYVDAIFISKFLSTQDLGVYSLATQINGTALQLPTIANTLLLPLFVTMQRENDNQRSANYFRNILPSLTLVWGLTCTVLAFITYFAIPLFFREEFRAAAAPLWILLAASTIAMPVAIGYSVLSNATSTTYISLIAGVLAAITNIIANFVLIPRHGLAGCAAATAAAFFVSAATFAVLIRRNLKLPLSWTAAAFLPCIAGAASLFILQSPWLGLAVCVALSFLIAYLQRDSLRKTFVFVKTFKAA